MDHDQMNELRELVEFLKANEVAEFDMERPELKVRLKFAGETQATAPADLQRLSQLLAAASSGGATAGQAVPSPASAALAEVAVAIPVATPAESSLHEVKSPIVGTFYESSAPGASPFVKPGDQVEIGQVLCIVEAMKLMNEIESDVAGEVVRRIAVSGQPVEYGQPLFAVRPR